MMPSLVISVAEWLASLRFTSSTEITTKAIFRDFRAVGESAFCWAADADTLWIARKMLIEITASRLRRQIREQ